MSWTHETVFPFSAPMTSGQSTTHDVYVGGEGPPILILQELPGIGPETLALSAKLNASGFRVYLPHLFGTYGKVEMGKNMARLFCVRREFNIFARGRQSPIAGWMRALTREIKQRENSAGVGVIGMCLTGSFALTLMAEDAVLGGVASQPALPILGGRHLHMSAEDIGAASAGMAAKGPGLAMRYSEDKLAPKKLMRALEQAFGNLLETVEYPGKDHSLLTLDFHEPAYQRVDAYFKARFGMA
ncbi:MULTISPECIES: dienelactone hydrolase family protein [unclassified Ruegeria]|jgi:dienelactone hydrolase|uniref:dienelactone hydrolase family protein n=1 Tax=unclassified Ruegeria TaxID=2625375 RepID=UPI00126899A6|nr:MULTISPECIES: dienelactone hydrolase family protein [unclassified Ruegeria]QFT72155.1 Dienelactone hydrolase family protein [Ruegeria sp. THAF33]